MLPTTWTDLVEPRPSVTDPHERRRRRMLLTFLLGLAGMSLGWTVLALVEASFRLAMAQYAVVVAAGFLTAFVLARWWDPRPGALAAMAVLTGVVWWGAFQNSPDETGITLAYLMVPVVVGSLVGRLRYAALGVALALGVTADPRIPMTLEARAATMAFLFIASMLLVGMTRLRESEAQRIEEARQDLEVYEGRFFREAPELLAIGDLEGHLIKVNPAWKRALGWSPEELTARPIADFLHPDDVGTTQQRFRRLAEGATPEPGFENRYRTRDGGWRWLRWESVAALDEARIYAVARDVTREKELEDELRRSEARLRSILENAPVGIFVATRGDRILEVNGALASMLGFEDAEAFLEAVTDPLQVYALPEERAAAVTRAMQAGRAMEVHVDGRRRDGSTFPASVNFVLLDEAADEEPLLLGIVRDLTMEEQLREARAAQEAQRARRQELEQLTRVTSHQLQEPIRDIVRFGQRLEVDLDGADGRAREDLGFILDGTRRLHDTIEGLRSYADVTSSRPEPRAVRVAPILHAVADRPTDGDAGGERSIPVTVRVEGDPWIAGDPSRLALVVDELVDNARRYGREGVWVDAAPQGDAVEIRIADDGPGLDPGQRERAFDLFSRLGARGGAGPGIGLALSRGIVQQYGGSIAMETREGGGALVRLRWPAADDAGA